MNLAINLPPRWPGPPCIHHGKDSNSCTGVHSPFLSGGVPTYSYTYVEYSFAKTTEKNTGRNRAGPPRWKFFAIFILPSFH